MHRESPCEKPEAAPPSAGNPPSPLKYQYPTTDTVPLEKLQQLGKDLFFISCETTTTSKVLGFSPHPTAGRDEVKECLANPHVRQMLISLVQSQTPDLTMKEAMQEPIFLELAHACLKVVEPLNTLE